jgi:hypothetical protein
MGMYDESWCAHCGAGMHYTEDGSALCGPCAVIDTREETIKVEKELQDILSFVKGRITELTELREQYQNEGDSEMDDYSAGAIDAYDIVRMQLED